MIESMERLLGELVDALDDQGLEPRLIGGLAVELHCELERLSEDADLLDAMDPRRWGMFARVTDDADMVVKNAQQAASVLEERKFCRASHIDPPPVRLIRGSDRVDLIEMGTDDGTADIGSALAALADQFEQFDDVVIAKPAALVVLKAVAWTARHADKDLVDVARLAFLDREAGRTRLAIASIVLDVGPRIQRCVRRIRDQFASPDTSGPGIFYNALRNEVGGLDDVEDVVREQTSAAVRELFALLPD